MDLDMPEQDINRLAAFNSEVARGLVHTEEYKAQMRDLQFKYDNAVRCWAQTKGAVIV